ncbi:Short transient receptor putative channel 2 [Cichlidogyrus casuarinus]|uniref:Short transient receptor putative channel 2 n=1 Tax=Cichlidogyrus casuarinus TaxID=1844966 RepID=A0ABD2PMB3_9PLAT
MQESFATEYHCGDYIEVNPAVVLSDTEEKNLRENAGFPRDSWDSTGSTDDDELNRVKKHMQKVKSNVMRRYLFKLQKLKEEENKSGGETLLLSKLFLDVAMMNMLRQQQQQQQQQQLLNMEEQARKMGSRRGSPMRSGSPSRKVSGVTKYGASETKAAGMEEQVEFQQGQDKHRAKWSKSLGGKRGLSSLLMPPSVRKRLEKRATEVPGEAAIAEETEEDTTMASYLMLEKSAKTNEMTQSNPFHPQPRPLFTESIWNETDVFTARTDKKFEESHLRELYRIEQEMNDMCEELSINSMPEATISEAERINSLLEGDLECKPATSSRPPLPAPYTEEKKRFRTFKL